ncbi:MAG TPA: leishmanolysin-related zinc metalloendopeptidase [Gemmatimonadales bacterium]|nr:leishmanolysin-related zinc metalloendopeptidase [Gemmatimonadales bacterium]
MTRRYCKALLLVAALAITACGGDSTGPGPAPVVAAPAGLAIVTPPATTVQLDNALQPAPVLELRDADGKPVAKAGVAVTAALINGTATGTTTATTGANGRAIFQGILVSGPLGAHELRFSSTGLSSASVAITLIAGAPAGMSAVSARLQNAAAGANTPEAPAVHLVDADGNPAAGATVQFAVLGGGGHVSVPAAVADANGTASAGAWTLGAGLNVLRAVSGTDTVLFQAGGASMAAQSVVAASRTTQTIVTGQELSEQPAVKVLGEGGTPVAGALVVFRGTSSADMLDDSVAITGTDGIGAAPHWKLLDGGPHHLTALMPGTALDTIEFEAAAIRQGALDYYRLWVDDQIVKVGTVVPVDPMVAVSSGGQSQLGVMVTFAVTQGGGTLATTTAVSDQFGLAQASGWSAGATPGVQTVIASAPGFNPQSVQFRAFAVESPPVTMSVLAGDGQSGVASHALAVDPAVKLADAAGNPLAGYPVKFTSLQGRIADTLVETNSAGVATGGHWLMPDAVIEDAQLQVSAPQVTGSPLVFHARSTAGTPARIEYSPSPMTGVVGTPVHPAISVLDADGVRLQGIPVTAMVTKGSGSVSHGGFTGQAGLWQADWTLDTIAGENELTASVPGLPAVSFTAFGVGGTATAMTIAAGDAQTGSVYSPLALPVSVHLTDRYGNDTPLQSVKFSSSGDGTTLPGYAFVPSDSSGIASLVWRLGSTPGGYTLTATSGDYPELVQTFTATATPVTSDFDIKVQYIGTPSPAMQRAVTAAVARWRAIISNDLPDATLDRAEAECFDAQPAIAETVDDILIYIETDGIDGVGGILGAAGPCLIRSLSRLPSMGYMHLDVADVAQLAANGQLQDVVLHEMGHILGIGTLWADRNYVLNPGSSNPRYSGTAGVEGYRDLGGLSSTVPVENTGGTGTADVHWREETFGQELMTGYISNADNPLTRMTIGSLQDLGYTVSLTLSEPLVISAGALAQLRTRPRRLIERTLPSPIIVVDQAGREVGRERRLR